MVGVWPSARYKRQLSQVRQIDLSRSVSGVVRTKATQQSGQCKIFPGCKDSVMKSSPMRCRFSVKQGEARWLRSCVGPFRLKSRSM
jgi:hypothetical protein